MSDVLTIEKAVENEFFSASFVRSDGIKLYGHILYKKWSKEAKKATIELLNSFNEPIYAYVHDKHHWKYLSSLGFQTTGDLITSSFKGKEHLVFPEVVYFQDTLDNYCLSLYEEIGQSVLPLDAIDGYGKIEAIENKIKELEQAPHKTEHFFSDNVYTRKTFIPKDTVLTGYRHRCKTVSLVLSGYISVCSVDEKGYGKDYGVLQGGDVLVTDASHKKIGYAHQDTVFVNSFDISMIDKDKQNEQHLDFIESIIFIKEQ